jgi:choline dehydrogenase
VSHVNNQRHRLLKQLGIETKVDLPGVGENLQDQPNLSLIYSGRLNVTGYIPASTFVTALDLYGNSALALAAKTRSCLSRWAAHIASQEYNGMAVESIRKILGIQHDLIFGKNVTVGEILTTASGNLLVSAFWALLPFSRGSVHLRSTSLEDANNPMIDPGFFQIDFDMTMQAAVGRLAQDFWTVAPMGDFVTENLSPGNSVLPNSASDEQWDSFIRSSCE